MVKGKTITKRFLDPETEVELVVIITYNDSYVILNFGETVQKGDRLCIKVERCTIKKVFLGGVIEALKEVYKKIKEEGGKNGQYISL